MWPRLGHFIQRRRAIILFLVIIGVGFLGFRRLEDNSADTRRLAEQNKELTLQLSAQSAANKQAVCEAEIATRASVQGLLLSMVDDFIPVGRPARYEIERRINDALGPVPDDC